MATQAGTGDQGAEGERFTTPHADREPTADEVAAADRGSAGVDIDSVAEEYEAMLERGANVRGEGQVEPD
jgi:hypothetical protein